MNQDRIIRILIFLSLLCVFTISVGYSECESIDRLSHFDFRHKTDRDIFILSVVIISVIALVLCILSCIDFARCILCVNNIIVVLFISVVSIFYFTYVININHGGDEECTKLRDGITITAFASSFVLNTICLLILSL